MLFKLNTLVQEMWVDIQSLTAASKRSFGCKVNYRCHKFHTNPDSVLMLCRIVLKALDIVVNVHVCWNMYIIFMSVYVYTPQWRIQKPLHNTILFLQSQITFWFHIAVYSTTDSNSPAVTTTKNNYISCYTGNSLPKCLQTSKLYRELCCDRRH